MNIKALTANQNQSDFKELEQLKWQTTKLQHMIMNDNKRELNCSGPGKITSLNEFGQLQFNYINEEDYS